MIGIARHTDYAARLILHLASLEPGARVSIAEAARQRHLPVPFLRRLISPLVKAGILESLRGAGGGIRLGRASAEISLLDLIRAMEGGVQLNRCVDHHDACPFAADCPVQVAWTGATRALEQSLDRVSFDALARGTAGHAEAHRRRAAPRPRSLRPSNR